MRTREGRLLDPEVLSRHLAGLQVGASLRGVEATVDGQLDRRGKETFLRLSKTDELVRLAALTEKVQQDPRTRKPERATFAERRAHQRLLAKAGDTPAVVRITGPLRQAGDNEPFTLEVRRFEFPAAAQPDKAASIEQAEVRSLTLGIHVNSPYGLGEPWPDLREQLLKFPGIERVCEVPSTDTETCEVLPRGGRLPDAKQLGAFIQGLGLGASLRGMEATVDGWLEKRDGQPVIRASGADDVWRLAPLTHKVQFDFEKKRSHPLTDAERRACEALLLQWGGGPRRVRVVGPVVKAADGRLTLEVRQFEFLNGGQNSRESNPQPGFGGKTPHTPTARRALDAALPAGEWSAPK